MKILMDQLKSLEKQLKAHGYKGPYLSGPGTHKRSASKKRKRSKSPRKRSRKRKQKGGAKKGSNVQSLMFAKHLWTVPKAVEWLDKHGFDYEKVDITDRYIRFRQFPPRGRMRTVAFSEEDGIKAILSYSGRSPRKRSRSPRKRSASKRKRRSKSKKSPRKRSKKR